VENSKAANVKMAKGSSKEEGACTALCKLLLLDQKLKFEV
jgi:hypothetical protein